MTPSSDQQTITVQKPVAWAAIMVGIFTVVLSFNGRLATVEANYLNIEKSLDRLQTSVDNLYPKGSE